MSNQVATTLDRVQSDSFLAQSSDGVHLSPQYTLALGRNYRCLNTITNKVIKVLTLNPHGGGGHKGQNRYFTDEKRLQLTLSAIRNQHFSSNPKNIS